MPNGERSNLAELIVDEFIAIVFVVCFLGTSIFLVATGKLEEFKLFAAIISPFVGTIVAFYFASKRQKNGG